MTTINTHAVTEVWESWAVAGQHQTRILTAQGSLFDALLKRARAKTYERAIALLRANTDFATAAALMIGHAAELHVRTPPLIGFDEAAVRYTIARTWQRCALMLDPSLAEVQPKWLDS